MSVVILGLGLFLTLPPFDRGAIWVGPLLIWSFPGVSIAAFLIALVPLTRMILDFRGPSDEPPRWRYRNR